MAAMRDLGLPHEKVNVNGGACAFGHPIGASGAPILVGALSARGLERGVAALCIAGGEATAMAVEAAEAGSSSRVASRPCLACNTVPRSGERSFARGA